MFRWKMLAVALVPCAATLAVAQGTVRPIDPVFVRAQTMVSDGNGAAGRALVDSVLKATPPYAPLYPVALYWRASLASNAADAESDYKHIVVDYPLAPQAEDALLRLAQLELARGDRDAALTHLQRIPRDYPRSKSLARASYWTARVLFEKNDVPNACAANANALSQATTDEIELRNQIQYQGQRCPTVAASSVIPPAPITASSTAAVTSSERCWRCDCTSANQPRISTGAGEAGDHSASNSGPDSTGEGAAASRGEGCCTEHRASNETGFVFRSGKGHTGNGWIFSPGSGIQSQSRR